MIKNKYIHIRVSQELKARLKAIADRLKPLTKTDIVTTGTENEIKRLEKEVNKMEKR